MDIHIVAGGPEILLPNLKDFDNENCKWVGVDKGVIYSLKNGINIDIAFGDFDSVSNDDFLFLEDNVKLLKKYKPEKDETDMELALHWALNQNPTCIRLFGATGGRLDHFFGNISLMLKPLINSMASRIEMIDKQNIIFITNPGTYKVELDHEKKYISFLPFTTDVKGLTLTGFKYPLEDCKIPISSTLCISNELISEYGTFSFTEGILMVIRSRD